MPHDLTNKEVSCSKVLTTKLTGLHKFASASDEPSQTSMPIMIASYTLESLQIFGDPPTKKNLPPHACIAFLFPPPFAQNSPALVAVMVRFSSRLVSWSAPNDHPLPRTSFGADRRAGSPGFSGWVKEIERLPFPSIMRHSARLAFIA